MQTSLRKVKVMKEFTAYCPNAQIPFLTAKHLKQFDRLNLAFVVLKDGKLSFDKLNNITHLPRIREANPNLKVLMSVGGAGAAGFSTMAMTSEGREDFAKQCLNSCIEYGLDGMDLDWEFPCSIYEGMDSSPKDKENFTHLLKTIREIFDEYEKTNSKHLELTIAAGVGQWFIDQTEVPEFTKYLDHVFLMTYDLRGFGQEETGHHTTLYTKENDIYRMSADSGIQAWLDLGVPAEKIHIGAGFYSHMWTNVNPDNNGLLQVGEGGGGFGPNYDELRDEYVNKNGYVRYWDDEAKVPWLFDASTFISYDDAESVVYKCEYAKEHDLGGLFFWRYLDDPDNELIDAIDENLK